VLDLSAIYTSYQEKDGRGQAAYAPEMMVRLLLYGYARGVYSSRKIQTRTFEDVAFRYLSGDQHPDHATIAEFRKRHLEALSGLFTQALLLCSEAGLVKLGHVSIDGTKIKANASKHKAMSYKHMNETEARLKQEIDALLAAAEKADAEEDAQYGKDRHGDELPAELQAAGEPVAEDRRGQGGFGTGSQRKAEQQRAEAEQKVAERAEEERRTGKKKRGARAPGSRSGAGQARRHGAAQLRRSGEPDHAGRRQQGQLRAGLQRADRGRFRVAGDRGAEVTQETNDKKQLLPMIALIAANLKQKPEKVSADTGYFSEANVTDEQVKDVDLYVERPRQAWRCGGDEQRSATSRRVAERGQCGKSYEPRLAHRVQNAQGDRRAGLRTDQGTARFSPLQLAWQRECQPRVESWCARSATC